MNEDYHSSAHVHIPTPLQTTAVTRQPVFRHLPIPWTPMLRHLHYVLGHQVYASLQFRPLQQEQRPLATTARLPSHRQLHRSVLKQEQDVSAHVHIPTPLQTTAATRQPVFF